jgi:hypothetical protein
MSIIAGKKTHKRYKGIELEEAAGKTIEAVTETRVGGAYGTEPCITFLFTDGTKTGIITPND